MTNSLQLTKAGNGTAILFIHGWGLNSGVWQPCLAELQQHFEVQTVDLPGFGNNLDCLAKPYSVPTIAAMIAEKIEQPCFVVGWSLGGLVATQLALEFPEKILGLVHVASTPYFVEEDNWPGIKPHLLTGFHQQLAQDIGKTLKGFLKIQAMGSPHIRQDIKTIEKLVMAYETPSRETLDDSLSLLETVDQRSAIADINVPMLGIYGRLDSLVPKRVIANIADCAPKMRQITMEQSSHAPFISELDGFVSHLTSFISETDR